ncbi:hypothetical protein Mgra_00004567 [Meloidogyne graminicola]|uniref:Uncharacterized protein n=1 Tax=Meloidogyne graminicola TaxID=189291 RepID=A0A8S9ZSH6_9BILA|nr:hypothetical protein Mgra_00004567 [Meloidogyne graminicola]
MKSNYSEKEKIFNMNTLTNLTASLLLVFMLIYEINMMESPKGKENSYHNVLPTKRIFSQEEIKELVDAVKNSNKNNNGEALKNLLKTLTTTSKESNSTKEIIKKILNGESVNLLNELVKLDKPLITSYWPRLTPTLIEYSAGTSSTHNSEDSSKKRKGMSSEDLLKQFFTYPGLAELASSKSPIVKEKKYVDDKPYWP